MTRQLNAVVSPEEHALISKRAADKGMTVSAYLRSLLKLPPREDRRKTFSLDKPTVVK